MSSLARDINMDGMMAGDFNEIVDSSEKKGRAPVDLNRCLAFATWINECNLIDMGFIGSKFT